MLHELELTLHMTLDIDGSGLSNVRDTLLRKFIRVAPERLIAELND
jgi:hypothetical protein